MPIGAGIQLSPNAMRIVRALGLEGPINAHASAPRSIIINDGVDGRRLTELELGSAFERRHGSPYLTIHRGDLQAVLLARAKREGIGLELSHRALRRDGSSVYFANGSSVSVNLIVAAEGVKSALVDGRRKRSGYVAWRAILPTSGVATGGDRAKTALWLVPNAHLVRYPVRSGMETNFVLVLREGERPTTASLPFPVRNAIASVDEWGDWPIEDRRTHTPWTAEGFAAIGDSVHAMWPYAAQGGAMAMEDGWTLASHVGRATSMAEALAKWEAERRSRTSRVAAIARRNRLIYHASGPLRLTRNVAMRRLPPTVLTGAMDRIYSWVPDTQAEYVGPEAQPNMER